MGQKHPEDSELTELLQNEESFNYGYNLLVKKYQEKIYAHIRRIVISHEDTDDVLQETFIKVWKNIKKFRSDSSLYTWIYRIATNEALLFLRKKRRFIPESFSSTSHKLEQTLLADPEMSGDKVQLRLLQAILTLPEKQRAVFNMKYFDELKYEEISEILGTSTGGLKASYHHAVKKIEAFIRSRD